MTDTNLQLKRIHTKLQQLLKQQAVLQKENSQLKEELVQTKKQMSAGQDMIDNLKQQVDVLRYSNGEMSDKEKKEFEKKISTYIKEIDRCIVMLSQ